MGQEQSNAQALLPGKPEVPRALQELPGTGDPPLFQGLPLHRTQPVASPWVPLRKGPLTPQPSARLWDGQEKLGAKGFILVGNKSGGDLFF